MYTLRELSPADGKDVYNMLQKMPAEENGFRNKFYGVSFEVFKKMLAESKKESQSVDLEADRVPQTVYWFYVNSKPVGVIKLRHYLNEQLLKHGGHIGYGVIPEERGKGYASKMLELALVKAKELGLDKVLITCDLDNIPSQKVAERNGAVLDKKDAEQCFYWIKV